LGLATLLPLHVEVAPPQAQKAALDSLADLVRRRVASVKSGSSPVCGKPTRQTYHSITQALNIDEDEVLRLAHLGHGADGDQELGQAGRTT
jgi:ribonucleotide monophosphatase NagD (HAD superfamily)